MFTVPYIVLGLLLLAHIVLRIFFRPREISLVVFTSVFVASFGLAIAAAVTIFALPDGKKWIGLALLLTSGLYLAIVKPLQIPADARD